MKKRLALVLAGTAALSALGMTGAMADSHRLTVPGTGTVAVEGGGEEDYELWLDGASTNPGPLSGYVAVHSDGDVFCSDHGGPFLDDGTDDPNFVEPAEGGNVHCPA